MKTTKKTTKQPEKEPTDATWADLGAKIRRKLGNDERVRARRCARFAKDDRRSAEKTDKDRAKWYRANATRYEKAAREHAALADLIERNT